jgi:hypothetical protein
MTTTGTLLESLKKIHVDLPLAGEFPNELLAQSPDVIEFLTSVLSNQKGVISKLSSQEWRTLIDRLSCHGIIPLLCWYISKTGSDNSVPTEIKENLRQIYHQNSLNNLRIDSALAEIIHAFDNANLEALVFKGPAFSHHLYPDPSLRPIADIDILVRSAQYDSCRQVLIELGFVAKSNRFRSSKHVYSQDVFFRSTGQTVDQVELHWRFDRFNRVSRCFDMEDLFARSKRINANQVSFRTMDLFDSFIQASFHLLACHTRHVRLVWIYDLRLLLDRILESADWDEFWRRCQGWKSVIVARTAIELVGAWTDIEVPDDVLRAPLPGNDELEVWRHILKRHRSKLSKLFLFFKKDSTLFEKVTHCYHLIFS